MLCFSIKNNEVPLSRIMIHDFERYSHLLKQVLQKLYQSLKHKRSCPKKFFVKAVSPLKTPQYNYQ